MSETENIELQLLSEEDAVDFGVLNDNYEKIDAKFGTVDEAIAAVELTPGPQGEQGEVGPDGPQGMQGVPGNDGATIIPTSGQPDDDDGNDGDYAIDRDLMQLWGPKESGSWDGTGPFSIKGDTGATGEDGLSIIYTMISGGSGPPTTEPIELLIDEFHAYIQINESGGPVWLWDTDGHVWNKTDFGLFGNDGENGTNGVDGAAGADGDRGALVHKVSGVPIYMSERDRPGDWAFRTNGDVWGPLSDDHSWGESPAFSIKGPTGAQGDPGPEGDQGPAGEDAPQNTFGIVARDTSVELSFNNINRHLDLAPVDDNFTVYVKGSKYIKTGSTVTVSDTTGLHYVYFNAAGALIDSMFEWDLTQVTPVAIVMWDAQNDDGFAINKLADVNMGNTTRRALSSRFGPFIANGFFPAAGYTLNSGAPTIVTNSPSIPEGTIDDADVRTEMGELGDGGPYALFYRNGLGGKWEWQRGQGLPYLANSTYVDYNLNEDDVWSFQDTGVADRFYNVFVCAWGTLEEALHYIVIMGQAEHETLEEAQAELFSALDLSGLPLDSLAPLWRFTFETDADFEDVTGQARIVDAEWIAGIVIIGAGGHVNPPPPSLLWSTHVIDDDYVPIVGDDSRAILLADTTDNGIIVGLPSDDDAAFEHGDEFQVILTVEVYEIEFQAGSGATMLSRYGTADPLTLDGLGAKATVTKIDDNTWHVDGDVHPNNLLGMRSVDLEDHTPEL